MADKSPPSRSAKSPQAREDRLKAALKANLSRRKAQARVRAGAQENAQDKTPGTPGQDKKDA